MADVTLHQALSTRQEERYVRQLEQRASRRDTARTDAAQQVEANARARQAQDAQAQGAANTARSYDAIERQRDAQLARDLDQLQQDRLQAQQRQQAQQAAQDQLRANQARQDQVRADQARASEQLAFQRLDANQVAPQAPNDRFADAIAAETNAQNLGNDPIRGRIVNLLA